MKKLCVFLILCLLVLIVPSLTPRGSVIAHGGIGGQVHNPHVARIPLNVGLDPMGLLGVPMYQDGGYCQLAEKSALVGDSPLFAFGYGEVPVEIESVFMEEGVSGTFSGDNPGGTITYAITGVQSDGPPTDKIDGWRTDAYGDLVGFASRSYSGYVVGDSITLSYGLSGEKFCKDLSFTSGDEHIFIGCYSWDDSAPSGSITFAAPPEGKSVTFSLKLWRNSDIGRTDIIVSGTFSRQRPAVEIIPVPVTEPDPPALPPIDPTSPPKTEVVLPPIPTPSQTDSDGLWTVVIGGMAIMGVAAAGLAVVGVGAAAAVLVARAKRRALDNNLDQLAEDEIVGYILELSTGEITLKVNQPQPVRITCWQVASNGSYKHAPQASIHIQPPPVSSLITVSPAAGQGSFVSNFYLNGVPDEEMYQISVTATGGGQSASATINIKIDPGLVLTLTTPEDRNTLEPGEDEGLWACASLEPETPNPNFDSGLENSKIIFEVKGPNADWIDAGQEGENEHGKWVYLLARAPSTGATLAPGNPTLVAKYQIGNTWLVEELKLELQAEYELKLELFDVPKTSDITYNSSAGEWQASSLLVYWVNTKEGKTPVDPGFEYGFPDPPIQVDPPVLHVKSDDFVVQNEHLYLLKFEVDQDLQQYFGEELTDNAGMVRLSVEALDSEGQSYTAEMDYQLRPSAITMHYYWTDSPGVRLEGEREHNGIALKPGELVAYEKDQIGVGAFLVRADQAEDFSTAYDQRLQIKGEPQAELRGDKSWEYLLHPEEAGEGMNRYAARLEAKEIEFYSRKEEPFEVQVEMSLDESRYPNYYKPYPPQVKIKIDPLHIFLKLWVFPGRQIGTSIAGAFMYVPSKGVAVSDFALTLDIQSKGSRLTADQTVQQTDGDGLACWTLSYQGMNWNNYRSNFFTVRCGVPKPEGGFKGTQVQIDIGKNVDQFVADVYQQRKHRDLNLENPDFETGSGFFATVADFIWPDFLCGPVNNIVDMVTNNYDTYTCSNLAYRIIKWWGERRTGMNNFDEKKITSMNGIDMGQYILGLIPGAPHTFAGIFLANVDKLPTDDPRGIDPWWIQNWSKGFRQRVNGLYTNANQYTMQAGLYAALALLAFLTLKFAAWWQGPEVAMSLKTRIMGTIFSGGGSLAWAASQGITVYSDGHIQGKNYIKTIDFDYSYDSIPAACASLKQKGIQEVKPIVEW